MPNRKRTTTNISTFVDRSYGFDLGNGIVCWLSDESHGTERRCMSLARFRETVAEAAAFLAANGGPDGSVVPLRRK